MTGWLICDFTGFDQERVRERLRDREKNMEKEKREITRGTQREIGERREVIGESRASGTKGQGEREREREGMRRG